MQKSGGRDIERVSRTAADDSRAGRRRYAAAARGSRFGFFDLMLAADGSLDRTIAGATTDIALERPSQIVTLRLIETRRRHDHARRAEATLKPLRLQKGLLHGVQLAIFRQAFDCRNGAMFGPVGGKDAAMDRLAIDQHRAGAAIACVASLLHAEKSKLAQKRAEALSGARPRCVDFFVHQKGHAGSFPASSRRISSAKCVVTCRRQAGAP